MRISIVGGSIAGPALALLLNKAGLECEVFEATPETAPQAGGVIGLDRESMGVLGSIGVPAHEVVPFESNRVLSVRVLDRETKEVVESTYDGHNTTWTVAHKALRTRLPEGVYNAGERVDALTQGDDHRGRLHLSTGRTVASDLILFADGRGSFGRKLLDPRPLAYAGYVAHRGLSDESDGVLDFVRTQPEGTQFNTFPIQRPQGTGTDWTFYARTSADQFRSWFGKDPTEKTFILPRQIKPEVVSAVDDLASAVLPAQQAGMVRRTKTRFVVPILDIQEPDKAVFEGGGSRAVLLGDALAPVRPHTAMGLNNGLHQAQGLVEAISGVTHNGGDLDRALEEWEANILPKVKETIQLGPQLGRRIGLQV